MRKILIIHDFIASTESFHSEHLHFIKRILDEIDLDTTIATKENFTFSKSLLYQKLNIPVSTRKINYIENTIFTSDAYDYVRSFVKEYDVIIGFELSFETKKILNSLNIIYIDLWISPIRFHKDLMFEFFSNNMQIQKNLKQYQYKEKKLFKQAEILKKHTKHYMSPLHDIQKNSAVIVGQLFEDKAVMSKDKFLNLLDYYNEVLKLSEKYNTLYLLKHPLMAEGDFKKIKLKFEKIKNLHYLQNTNTYELLIDQNIKCVAGISSSLLTEAKYFGKKVLYFYKPVLDETYIRIYKQFYKTSFWHKILGVTKGNDFKLLTHDNYLRYTFDAFYAYKKFVNDRFNENSYKNIIQIYKLLETLDTSKQYILYGFGSVGKLILPHIPNLIGIIDKTDINLHNSSLVCLSLADLHKYNNAYVIISPFIYTQEIKRELLMFTDKIIELPH